MRDPLAVVTEFLTAISGSHENAFANAVRRWFTPETVWDNVGLLTTIGADEAIAAWQGFGASGLHSLRVETLAIAAQGSKVLTERVDHMLDAGGNTTGQVAVMGIFEVGDDGRILRWSDYFDPTPFKQAAAAAS
ncbi:MAG: nuclear transport factor 2 family protein [Sphingomonadaceae bacterium]|nr:nuclear transport factor 2 family protein [Sphingomonadaceae bacterium]